MEEFSTLQCIVRSSRRAYSLLIFILLPFFIKAQGRVLINEYLPWPNNACGTTAEFIELYNFGPGPVNLGGYTITDGDYAITIPANTVLLPGNFFVLAGQDIILQSCGNDLRNVTVNLNWNTCGCTSAPIPTTGDGFLTDGGSANEQIVLLDTNLTIIDAIVRSMPMESSSLITTSTVGGQYAPRVFDLDNMSITYETVGESAGRGNSFARKIDGGCGWIKDTQESAGDINNTSGLVLDWSANLTITKPTNCAGLGSVQVAVSNALLFPMRYTLAKDADANFVYDLNDIYTTGVDSTASTIPLGGLDSGRYRLIIEGSLGCDATQFDFAILPCAGLILEHTITDFKSSRAGQDLLLSWNVPNRQIIRAFDIEQSKDGRSFVRQSIITDVTSRLYDLYFYTTVRPVVPVSYYRVKLITTEGAVVYSPIITAIMANDTHLAFRLAENPFTNHCTILADAGNTSRLQVILYDLAGRSILGQKINVQKGSNIIRLSTQHIQPGMYMLQLRDENGVPVKTVKVIRR